MDKIRTVLALAVVFTVSGLIALPCFPSSGLDSQEPDGLRLASNLAEVKLGDRLFFETRFAQYFFAHCGEDVNRTLEEGDHLVDQVPAVDRPALPGPFRGQSISCRQCHLGDDFIQKRPLAGRTYADFSRHS